MTIRLALIDLLQIFCNVVHYCFAFNSFLIFHSSYKLHYIIERFWSYAPHSSHMRVSVICISNYETRAINHVVCDTGLILFVHLSVICPSVRSACCVRSVARWLFHGLYSCGTYTTDEGTICHGRFQGQKVKGQGHTGRSYFRPCLPQGTCFICGTNTTH